MSGHAPDEEAAVRQRVLEVALDRRPDMRLGDLVQALAAVGIDAAPATVVADLDALGYDVEDASATAGPGDPTTRPPATPVEPSRPPAAAPDRAATARAPAGADDPGPWWQGRAGAGALAAAVLVAALLAAFLVSRSDSEAEVAGGPGPSTGASTTAAPSGATTAPAAPSGPLETNPVGPGQDPELVAGVDGTASFDAAAGGLGPAPDGGGWSLPAGTWSVAEGRAVLEAVEGESGVGLATFDPGLTSYRLQVRLGRLQNGNGLVFAVEGPESYWAFVAAPVYSTFFLVHVVDGRREIVDGYRLTATEGDTAVIGVHVTPGQVEALVNGAVVQTHILLGAVPTAIGIGSLPGAAGGTFDEVSYRADP